MTKEERKYLRAIFHHYNDLNIRHTNTPDTTELAREWRKFKEMQKGVFLVLALRGDVDEQIKEDLDEFIERNKIKLL